jgi:hypothetical protein
MKVRIAASNDETRWYADAARASPVADPCEACDRHPRRNASTLALVTVYVPV